jgi:hypothetical protein
MTRRRFFTATALAALLAIVIPAVAVAGHWIWKTDGNDSGAVSDIKRVGLEVPKHTPFGKGGPIRCRIDFVGEVPEGEEYARCFFDTKGGKSPDVVVVAYTYGGKFVGSGSEMDGKYTTDSFDVKAVRTAKGDIIIYVPRKRMRGREGFVRYRAHTQDMYVSEDYDDHAPSKNGYYTYHYK